jgi:hypothetical protein
VTVSAQAGTKPVSSSAILFGHRSGGAAVPRLKEVLSVSPVNLNAGESRMLEFSIPLTALNASTFGTDGLSRLPGATKVELCLQGANEVRKEVTL